MKIRGLLPLFLLLFLFSEGKAQSVQFVVPDFYWNRIKTLDQFINRFNRKDIPTFADSSDSNLPYLQVISCFNMDSVRNQPDDVILFAKTMVDYNVTIDRHSSNYVCEIDCAAEYNSRPCQITISLLMEQGENGGYSWSIAKAEGDVLKMIPDRSSSGMYISPVDNEMDFYELFGVFEKNPEELRNYYFPNVPINETSIFLALVASRKLKIKSFEDMRYVFYVEGYEFNVGRFDRESNNNGWLIYSFEKNEVK